VDNYSVLKLFRNIKLFDQYYNGSSTKSDIYSGEGVFTIENGKLYKIVINDVKTKKYTLNQDQDQDQYQNKNKFGLILDESYETKCDASQVPFDHVTIQLTSFFYKIHPKSTIQMVIVGEKRTPTQSDSKIITKNTYDEFMPYDFYFDGVGEDISVFLSMFN
jgi:hypothetical protein